MHKACKSFGKQLPPNPAPGARYVKISGEIRLLLLVLGLHLLSAYTPFMTSEISIPPIPETILQKEPSAELKPNQLDSDSLPPYDQLDRIIEYYIEKKMGSNLILEKEKTELNGASKETIERITKSIDKNEYKRRQSPPGIKITSTSFGKDRRMPIASKWNR